jgi:hypothetical protein
MFGRRHLTSNGNPMQPLAAVARLWLVVVISNGRILMH